jgi:hypothetical protein
MVDRYMLGGEYLNWCTEARDLGVLDDNKLLFNQHIANIVLKAHIRARLILHSFSSRDCNILMKAFITYMQPLLEYCSSVRSPFTATNISKIEAVQRSFTRIITGLSSCCYNDRLYNLHLELLIEIRRRKYDLVTMYKLIQGYFGVCNDVFSKILQIAILEVINIKYANSTVQLMLVSMVFLTDV